MLRRVAVIAAFVASLFVALPASAAPITGTTFGETWARTDLPVKNLAVSRTWMWGPEANTPALSEPYAEAPGGQRTVEYFDKSRMEDNSWRETQSPWNVTNGLLAEELITGRLQLSDNQFEQHAPAQVNVAGDLNDPNGPTYATFNPLMGYGAIPNGWVIIQTVNRAGTVGADPSLTSYHVSAQDVGAPTHHTVASVFWQFMTSRGLVYKNGGYSTDALFQNAFYATGYPLTEAYWTNVLVGGTSKLVLVQVFERRVLTYTPSNPAGWQVEAGNVGQHYYTWRYQQLGKTPASLSPQPPVYNPALRTAAYQGVSFSYDSSLASSVSSHIVPPAGDISVGFMPQELTMQLNGYPVTGNLHPPASVTIFSTAALAGTGDQTNLDRLSHLLSQRPALSTAVAQSSGPDPNQLYPVPPALPAAQMFAARPDYLSFQNGSGIRWITEFAQNLWPAENDMLVYVYQGLSSDGQYYASVMLPITTQLSLPHMNRQNMDAAAVIAYNQQAVNQIGQLAPAGFTPNLDTLDALVTSLTVTPNASLAASLAVQR